MAINDWWAGDGAERYWMEITVRDDLGVDLNAPTLNAAGREEWGYTLVTETRPGDVVLHWHATLLGYPALVGWSTVTGPLSIEDNYSWLARGTRGRNRGVATTGQGWRMPCAEFKRLARPVGGQRLAEVEPRLREVHRELSERVRGSLYFPFVFYRPGQIRAAQTYLTKFPAALLPVFAELDGMAPTESPGGSRRVQDSKLRRAIEQHAVREVTRYYLDRGATHVEELGKPYDLRVVGLGPERHVEVKGSSRDALAVELTVNEVAHAHNHRPTDLVVVDRISVRRLDNGEYATTGGNLRVWTDWAPDERRLAPTKYSYTLDSPTGT
ncbi:protein of unknown function [Actinokineospora alba]|uniref:Protein NO VEIN C-terminal domain-containing protein n=1 Tax=Actinokineospora alba TaxID=504798 RepID=A0A1H0STK7_9PSEU|nr:DUF3883 domain-containing protein [Actinokineospora alba]TDP66549.1 uncharacterized protein DUF3883 [Actinokineospora alba]SDJ37508.1 protein of unknown function [Actinokineospora alba]SDP44955.1 protein of unknown function [Actinokineospora alba]